MDFRTTELPDVISIAAFSHSVECIYDCALDPARWPEAIRKVCEAARCIGGLITIADLTTGAVRQQQHWNYAPDWLERIPLS